MPTNEGYTIKQVVLGMITTATVFGAAQNVYAANYIDPSFLNSVAQTASFNIQNGDDIISSIQLDTHNAGLTIVSSHSEIVSDKYFGEMKLMNYFVELHGKTIEDMVSINMQIIDQYNLFDKEKIVLTFYAV